MTLFSNVFDTEEARFWKWFQKHSAQLLSSRSADDPISDRLGKELKRIDDRLVFEFSVPKEGEKKEFTISADGIAAAIEPAVRLFNARPRLESWDFKLFRQRSGSAFNIRMNGIEIKGDDTRYLLVEDETKGKIGILLFYQNFSEPLRQDFGNITFLFLDSILGEYDVMTKVGLVEVFGFDSKYFPDSSPLRELSGAFDAAVGSGPEA